VSPIKPENKARYGEDWPEFSNSIRFGRAGGRCECQGECGRGTHQGRCPNRHGEPAYGTGATVVLTSAHLCHTPECREHVIAMCNGCHLHYDKEHHAQTRAATKAARAAAAGQGTLDFETSKSNEHPPGTKESKTPCPKKSPP
jgi:hypothetical protein